MLKQFKIGGALLAVLTLSACASVFNTADNSSFACQENDDCPTPLEVYSETHSSPKEVRFGRTPESWKSGQRNKEGSKKDLNLIAQENQAFDLTKGLVGLTTNTEGAPIKPMREKNMVLRIWIAPWVDKEDNLNMPGHLFTDVSPKKWSFGEQEIRHFGFPSQVSQQ